MKYIRSLNYEPTKEEGLNFNDSNDKDEDFSISRTANPRRLSFPELLKEHFSEHWLEWLISGFSIVLVFFTFSAKVELSNHEIKIDQNKNDINSSKNQIEEILKYDNKQDLQIQANKIHLEYLDKVKNNNGK